MEGDANEFGEIDGVYLLVSGVEAEEDRCGGVGQWVDEVVGIGEVVAGERDDDLSVACGEDALVAVGGVGVTGVPERSDERGKDGMGAALQIEHASTSQETTKARADPCPLREAIVGQ